MSAEQYTGQHADMEIMERAKEVVKSLGEDKDLIGWVLWTLFCTTPVWGVYWDADNFRDLWAERQRDAAEDGREPALPDWSPQVLEALQRTPAWHRWGPEVLSEQAHTLVFAEMFDEAVAILADPAAFEHREK